MDTQLQVAEQGRGGQGQEYRLQMGSEGLPLAQVECTDASLL
jgi:hypothetical protein